MSKKSGIYKFTNKINGKIYIGQSIDMEKRYTEHINSALMDSLNKYQSPITRALKKYGIENFDYEIVEKCVESELGNREKYWIKYYDSYKNGYNMRKGSDRKMSLNSVMAVKNLLLTTKMREIDIATMFNVSIQTISNINRGHQRRIKDAEYPIRKWTKEERGIVIDMTCPRCGKKRKYQTSQHCRSCNNLLQRVKVRPGPDILAKKILENGFSAVGREYSVSHTSIIRWCKSSQIGGTIEEISSWYEKNKA